MAEPLINNSVYPKNHITERKVVEEGKLKTTNFSGDKVHETGKIKVKEDVGSRVSQWLVRKTCSVHEGSILLVQGLGFRV